MRWAVPFGVLVDPDELVDMVKEGRLASAAGAFVNRWPWNPPEGDPAAYAGSRPDNPTITFVCACGCDHAGRPADAVFVGCGAAWNQRMRVVYDIVGGRDAAGQIRKTQFLVLAGVALIAASGFFAFANPNLF